MGFVDNITAFTFPRQSANVGKEVSVAFHFNYDAALRGTIVREDSEEPYVMIIQLENGRYILGSECQYR